LTVTRFSSGINARASGDKSARSTAAPTAIPPATIIAIAIRIQRLFIISLLTPLPKRDFIRHLQVRLFIAKAARKKA